MCSRILKTSLFVANCEFPFLPLDKTKEHFSLFSFDSSSPELFYFGSLVSNTSLCIIHSSSPYMRQKQTYFKWKLKTNKAVFPFPLYYQVASHRLPVLSRTMFPPLLQGSFTWSASCIFSPLRNLSQLELMLHFDKIKIPLHMPLLRISHVYAGELISLLEAWWYSLPPIH